MREECRLRAKQIQHQMSIMCYMAMFIIDCFSVNHPARNSLSAHQVTSYLSDIPKALKAQVKGSGENTLDMMAALYRPFSISPGQQSGHYSPGAN